MKKLLLFFLLLLISVNKYNAQISEPRQPQKKILSAESKKSGAFIDVNAAGYQETNFSPLQLVKDVLISSGSNTCLVPNVTNATVTPNSAVSNNNRSWGQPIFLLKTELFYLQDLQEMQVTQLMEEL